MIHPLNRKCAKCKEVKPLIEGFYPKGLGYHYQCKECQKATQKNIYASKHYFEDQPPECKCGGKVLISPLETRGGPCYSKMIYLCVACGKKLGVYSDKGLSPEKLLEAMYRQNSFYEQAAEDGYL